jgi:hypothetical protein
MSLSCRREIGSGTERRFSPISHGFALLQTAMCDPLAERR